VPPPDFPVNANDPRSLSIGSAAALSMSSSFLPLLVSSPKYFPDEEWSVSQTDPKAQMPRRLVWIEEKHFRGFGCSECAWVFNPSGSATGSSFDEMMRNFELLRDSEFSSHLCADHPRSRSSRES
jgi:hypothetical protein